jgi:hypothetical protein
MRATQEQYEKCVTIYSDKGQQAVYKYAKENAIDEWSKCIPCEDKTPDCEDFCCLVCGTFKRGMDNKEVEALKTLREKGYAVVIWYPDEHRLKIPKSLEDRIVEQSWEIINILKEDEKINEKTNT